MRTLPYLPHILWNLLLYLADSDSGGDGSGCDYVAQERKRAAK